MTRTKILPHMAGDVNFHGMVYRSEVMHRLQIAIEQVMYSDITVLIMGESGTGKELVAHAIHRNGPRKNRRFLPQNAGALPDTLLESELFGHRRGAFSGAVGDKMGFFEAADGATVFLDEIGEASMALQVRLLRLLETGTFRRVGDTRDRVTDVRIIAATNRDLKKEVALGRFREDLYYRLCVFPIQVPPLREHMEDIPLLADYFIQKFSRELNRSQFALSLQAKETLMDYKWPGNVRELKNYIHRLMILAQNERNGLLPLEDKVESTSNGSSASTAKSIKTLAEVERDHITHVLDAVNGNQSRAAFHLGLKRGTFRSRLKKLGIQQGC